MKKTLLTLSAALASCAAVAARSSSFGINAFNAATPADDGYNRVFSPIAFEMDCCAFGEATDTITRAGIAEELGVLTDFSAVYGPIIDHFTLVAPTNGFSFISARGLCLPNISMASPEFRRRLWEFCEGEVCMLYPADGAQSWFRAKMMGEMEDFDIPVVASQSERYHFYDLVSVKAAWRGASDAVETRKFRCADGTEKQMKFFRLKRTVRYAKTAKYTILRLPLGDGANLFAMLPAPGASLADVRAALTGEKFEDIRTSVDALGASNAGAARCVAVFPAVDFTASTSLSEPFLKAKVPQGGFLLMHKNLTGRESSQIVRFRLEDDSSISPDEPEYAADDLGDVVFDRPFAFFVHRPEDNVLSAVGQFTGKDK